MPPATAIEVKPKPTTTSSTMTVLTSLVLFCILSAQSVLIYRMVEDGAATNALAMSEGFSVRSDFVNGKIRGDIAVGKLESISRVGAPGFNALIVAEILQRENKFEERNKFVFGEINRLPDHQLAFLFKHLPDSSPDSIAPELSFFNSLTTEQAQKVKACQEKITAPEGELQFVKAIKVGYNALYPHKSQECMI